MGPQMEGETIAREVKRLKEGRRGQGLKYPVLSRFDQDLSDAQDLWLHMCQQLVAHFRGEDTARCQALSHGGGGGGHQHGGVGGQCGPRARLSGQ